MFRILISALMIFAFSDLGNAQLIDYSRRNKYKKENSRAQLKKQPAQAAEASSPVFSSEIAVENRSEKVYDTNDDDKLDQEEMKTLLADVLTSVERWGQFPINGKFLVQFDDDQDGVIDLAEAAEIKKLLE